MLSLRNSYKRLAALLFMIQRHLLMSIIASSNQIKEELSVIYNNLIT